MLKELSKELSKELKEKLPVGLSVEDAVLITTTTLRAMESHLSRLTLFNRSKLLGYAVDIAEGLLTEPCGTE